MMRLLPLLLLILAALPMRAQTAPADSAAIRSLEALRLRADQGDTNAIFRLARALESGYRDILPQDSARARTLLTQAARAGYAPAQNYLGFQLFKEEKPDSAIYWMMLAADQGDLTAYTNLGWMLLNGQGAVPDADKAVYWLQKGTQAGSAPAAVMLGDVYRTGNGLDADTLLALDAYDLALSTYSSQNHHDQLAIAHIDSALSALYVNLDSIPQQKLRRLGYTYMDLGAPLTGARILNHAIERGDHHAMARMAKAYALGQGVPYSHAKSLQLYTLAAINGDPAARYIIAELLQMLPDALADLPQEIAGQLSEEMNNPQYWYEKAELQGITSAHEAERALMTP